MLLDISRFKLSLGSPKVAFLLLLLSTAAFAQETEGSTPRKVSSGLLVNGGVGFARNASDWYDLNTFWNIEPVNGEMAYKGNVALGYRFRIEPGRSKRFFFDMDLLLDARFYQDIDHFSGTGVVPRGTTRSNSVRCSFAFSPSANYRITEQLYAGIGLEPTVYFAKRRNLDLPIVWKVGYRFGKVDVALNYRLGLAHTLDKWTLPRGEVSDLNLSVYLPFFSR